MLSNFIWFHQPLDCCDVYSAYVRKTLLRKNSRGFFHQEFEEFFQVFRIYRFFLDYDLFSMFPFPIFLRHFFSFNSIIYYSGLAFKIRPMSNILYEKTNQKKFTQSNKNSECLMINRDRFFFSIRCISFSIRLSACLWYQ